DLIQNTPCFITSEVTGVNNLEDLISLEQKRFIERNKKLLADGVRVECLTSVRISENVTIAPGVVIESGVRINADQNVRIGKNTVIHQGNIISNTSIGENCTLKPYNMIEDSVVGDNVSIGPFAHLRPGS